MKGLTELFRTMVDDVPICIFLIFRAHIGKLVFGSRNYVSHCRNRVKDKIASLMANPEDLAHFENSESQNLQDLAAYFFCGGKSKGLFVEAGACDGILLSNTASLENYFSWKGILLEPDPRWEFTDRRSCRFVRGAIAAAPQRSSKFFQTVSRANSSLIRRGNLFNRKRERVFGVTEVECYTLTEIQKILRVDFIDFLSLDIEGSEYDVIFCSDFAIEKVGFFCVEHNYNLIQMIRLSRAFREANFERVLPDYSGQDFWFANKQYY